MSAEQVDEVHKGEDRDETSGKKEWSRGQKARIEAFSRPLFEPGHAPDEHRARKKSGDRCPKVDGIDHRLVKLTHSREQRHSRLTAGQPVSI
jgi:hypothetical protein